MHPFRLSLLAFACLAAGSAGARADGASPRSHIAAAFPYQPPPPAPAGAPDDPDLVVMPELQVEERRYELPEFGPLRIRRNRDDARQWQVRTDALEDRVGRVSSALGPADPAAARELRALMTGIRSDELRRERENLSFPQYLR